MTAVAPRRPGPGAPRPYRFPPIVRSAVAGGQVVAADLPGHPLAVAALLLDAGAGREPAGSEGVAAVVADALEEGTTERGAGEYAVALERLGAELTTTLDWDFLRVAVRTSVDGLAAAVDLLAEAVRAPRLDPDDLVRVRDDQVTRLRMDRAQPGPRAETALLAEIFEPRLRQARPLRGDPASVAGLSTSDIAGYHATRLRAPGVLLVVGDLDRIDLPGLAAAAFAGSAAPAGRDSDGAAGGAPEGGRRILLVDRPGAVQSTLRLGHPAPPRAHPDHVPTQLAGTVLGGAFTSRLNHLLREVRGYTYGVRAEFGAHRGFGRFTVRTAVHTAATAPALVDAVAEISRTQEQGVTADELSTARQYRAGQLLVEMQSPNAIRAALTTLVVHDLPDDHYPALWAQLTGAGLPEVCRAAATHLHPQRLALVVEGDAATVRDELAAAGLGEVVEVDP